MAKVAPTNTNGSDFDQECVVARKWMAAHYDQMMIPLRFYSDQEVPRKNVPSFDPAEDDRQVAHLRKCKGCEGWLQTVCETEWIDRQRRLSQYCCPQLFGAVEETRRGKLKITLQHYSPPHYEGAHNWQLSVVSDKSALGSLLINYCPFCGQPIKTPDEP